MKPPPAKPFAILFGVCLGIFILWGIIGSMFMPQLENPASQDRIGKIVLPIAFLLFTLMGFSAVPVMARLFFKLYFKAQSVVGMTNHPVVQALQTKQEVIVAVVVYAVWGLYALGLLIGAPFFFRDMWK